MGLPSAQQNIWKILAIIGLWLATTACSQAGAAAKVSSTVAPDTDPLFKSMFTVWLLIPPASNP